MSEPQAEKLDTLEAARNQLGFAYKTFHSHLDICETFIGKALADTPPENYEALILAMNKLAAELVSAVAEFYRTTAAANLTATHARMMRLMQKTKRQESNND
ncbi:hypothetical protein [Canibacter oris]|uniref:Uncharacterized protein n=1 Tax=Canibacter oris TaxID=1365628 RepID=A0A840DNH8_9MICO|nr:hypothetical protein [Canibacter oris]MBB4071598.1 hypothetical protein [Canibacter oris]